jgi:NDP-sugar pyrophosphorylase family protein
MKAVILAGGRGTRLEPYTTVLPKPLVPIGNLPVVEILLWQLVTQGVDDITLTVGYLGELIKAYFSQRPRLMERLRLSYVDETRPTGTAGSLALVPGLDETFLAMNGDILTTLSFKKLVEHHARERAALTIATHTKRIEIDLGVIETDAGGRVIGYREKPSLEHRVSMGIYVYEPRVLSHIERGAHLDFPDLVLKLIAAGEKVASFPSDDIWLDIGRKPDLDRALKEFQAHRAQFCAGFEDEIPE